MNGSRPGKSRVAARLRRSNWEVSLTDVSHVPPDARGTDRGRFLTGLARAFGGAVIFSLPMLMTMEMWWLGFSMSGFRLALLLSLGVPLLVGLSYYIGFEETFRLKDDAVDAFVAYAVGFATAASMLTLFSVIEWGMSAEEVVGKVSLQAVPGSIGAMLAQSQLGGERDRDKEKKRQAGYGAEVFIMAVGALFLAFNLAPTEEMLLIARKMTDWHTLALALLSLVVMHAFVYVVEFEGQARTRPGASPWGVFARYTVVGYAVSLLISLYVLWTFGRTDGSTPYQVTTTVVVLSFPAAVGAAAARLIL